jgi:glycosyltransferase involved in cell wall biosynthesis
MAAIPISVIVMTKNNGKTLRQCLDALRVFDAVHVVDSDSQDDTPDIAAQFPNVSVKKFSWNGQYPKKKQWCLDHLTLTHDWILMCDADEIVSPTFVKEIRERVISNKTQHGFFVRSQNVVNNQVMRHGMMNKKLALFKRKAFYYPVLNDLFSLGSFEVEGHYQPSKQEKTINIGIINAPILHLNTQDMTQYKASHDRYVVWEADMTKHNLWPNDPILWRQVVKQALRVSGLKPLIVFVYSYIIKGGFLDGVNGWQLAKMKFDYYCAIQKRLKSL